jgi:ABC-type Fe3+ transport system permease subunit
MATTTARSQTRTATPETPARRGPRVPFETKMLSPALLVLAAVSIFPFIYIILMSLSRVGLIGGIFAELPRSLEEAAMVDGASRWMSFRRIALPLALPGVATTAILCLVFSWNDYAFAVTFSGPDSQTLPIAASQLVTQTSIDWGQLTAIGTIVVAPMILVGLIVRKWLVTGLTLGAVTGE